MNDYSLFRLSILGKSSFVFFIEINSFYDFKNKAMQYYSSFSYMIFYYFICNYTSTFSASFCGYSQGREFTSTLCMGITK